jgi:hypothetical protein
MLVADEQTSSPPIEPRHRLIWPAGPMLRRSVQGIGYTDDHAHLDHKPGAQPRDVHLAGTDFLGDLRLGVLFKESQPDQPPLVIIELNQSRL